MKISDIARPQSETIKLKIFDYNPYYDLSEIKNSKNDDREITERPNIRAGPAFPLTRTMPTML